MTILRSYTLTAAEGRGRELCDVLRGLASLVRPLPGCEGVDIYVDPADPHALVFIEHWRSIEAHQASGAMLGKDAFVAVLQQLDGPPMTRYLTRVAPDEP